MEQYICITLGPVFDTINLASSPAALWTGSYLFSYLSKTICRTLTKYNVPENDIISPYYTDGEDQPENSDGVGLYHDRIVFRQGKFPFSDFDQVRQDAIEHVADTFRLPAEYLKEYFLIRAVQCESDSPIIDSTKALDCLELNKPLPAPRSDNPLLELLVGKEHFGNERIKQLPLTKGFTNWHLRKNNGSLKSVSDISGEFWNTGMKKHHYYAIVRADGDHMGDIISSLHPDQMRDFSKKCIFYCAQIAADVAAYGGVTIYSGGDDLLAIMPCENRQGKNVLEFAQEANETFKAAFAQFSESVSLSFGITICYNRFPLYEALEDSQNMLFGAAKSKRNCVAIHIQKHSGQTACLVIANDALPSLIDFYKTNISPECSQWIRSAHHALHNFRMLFQQAGDDPVRIKNLFMNLFDADSHRGNEFLHTALREFYCKLLTELDITHVDDQNDSGKIDTLVSILRFLKFFTEKEGERND